jgi:hypothetical protein
MPGGESVPHARPLCFGNFKLMIINQYELISMMKYRKTILSLITTVFIGIALFQNIVFVGNIESPASDRFSGENAFRHLEQIAQQPRRMYQPFYEQVKSYVINELTQLGVPVEVQQTTAIEPRAPIFYSSVENIIATIKGTSDKGDAILLVAHLDSEPHIGPGAADNGGGVASFLELARALKRSSPLANDVILLFSVPEECGMQGAVAFVKEHPRASSVRIVFNCDGMGTGKYTITNISPENNWLIAEATRAYPKSLAYSYISSSSPMGSREDLVFRLAGYPTIDLSSSYFFPRYWHTKHDNLSLISSSGLQENGDHLLALMNHFGTLDLTTMSTHESVFFSILNLFVVQYPKYLLIPFMVLMVCISIAILMVSRKQSNCTVRGIAGTLIVSILGIVFATGVVRVTWFLITEFHPLDQFLLNNASYNRQYYYIGFIAASVFSVAGTFLLASRKLKISTGDLGLGILAFLNLYTLIAAWISPHYSAIIVWIVFALQALLVVRFVLKESYRTFVVTEILYAGLIVLLLVPAMSAQSGSDDNELFRYASAILFTLALLPVFYDAMLRHQKSITAVFGLTSVLLLTVAVSEDFGVKHPRVTYVSCNADADHGNAFWYIRNLYKSGLDGYSQQFMESDQRQESIRTFIPDYPYNFRGYFTRVDSMILAPPTVEMLKDSVSGGYRYLDVRIKSVRDAWEISVFKDPHLEVFEYALDGKPYGDQFSLHYTNTDSSLLCHYRNPRREGITLSFKVKAGEDVNLKIRDRTYGIPMRQGKRQMSDAEIPWIDYGANTTTVIKTFQL